MIARSHSPTLSEAIIAAIAAYFNTIPSAALLLTPKVHLFTANSGAIAPNATVAQFTEATFAGYAAVALSSLTAPLNFNNNLGLGSGEVVTFAASSGITPPGQSALGYWIDNGSTVFYAAELFAAPINFVFPFDFLELGVLLGSNYTPTMG